VQEAAQISGYHPERIRELVREGKVNAKKFSIVWMVDRSSLLSYAESQGRPSQDPKPKVK
jgi:hypothetical protein